MVGNARQRSRAWQGGALLVLLIGLAVFIFFMDDVIRLFDRRYAVVVVMPRAPGVTEGSPVWVGGKEVGVVTSIGFLPSGPDTTATIAITLDLPRRVQRQVRTDSRARLTSARLIGEIALDLVPGTRNGAVLTAGDTIRIAHRLSFADLRQRAAIVQAQLDSTMQLMQQVTPRLRARMTQTRRAFAALERALIDARSLQSDIASRTNFGLLRDTAFTASLERSRVHAAELARTIAAARTRMAANSEIRAAVTRLQLRADSVRTLLDATATLLDAGFLGRMQRDSALAHAILAARAELDSVIAETKRNPLRYFFK